MPAVPTITTRRFGDQMFSAEYPGDRGVVIVAETGYTGDFSFARYMPDVYLTDSGEVEISGHRVPVETFTAWLVALRFQLESHHFGQELPAQ